MAARGDDDGEGGRRGPSRVGRKSIHSARYDLIVALLREERVAAGLTQTELARRLGRRQTFISKVEQSERRIDLLEWLEWVEGCGGDPAGFVRRLREREQHDAD